MMPSFFNDGYRIEVYKWQFNRLVNGCVYLLRIKEVHAFFMSTCYY